MQNMKHLKMMLEKKACYNINTSQRSTKIQFRVNRLFFLRRVQTRLLYVP